MAKYYAKKKGYRKYKKYSTKLAKAVVPIVNRQLKKKIETKELVSPFYNQDIIADCTSTGVVSSMYKLNDLSEGTHFDELVGLYINCKSLYLQGIVRANNTPTRGACIRMSIIWDKNPQFLLSATAPAPSGIYEAGNYGPGGIASVLFSPKNINYGNRFKILYDKRIYLTSSTGTFGNKLIKKYIDLKGMKTQFGASGSSFEIQQGALYLMLQSDQVTDFPTFTGTVAFKYQDP